MVGRFEREAQLELLRNRLDDIAVQWIGEDVEPAMIDEMVSAVAGIVLDEEDETYEPEEFYGDEE